MSVQEAVGRRVNDLLRRAYRDGFMDAVEDTLDELTGKPSSSPHAYTGPIPPELRAWADKVRGRVAAERTGTAAS